MAEDLKTSASQLRTLQSRGSDPDWESFYRKYAAIILSFCRNQGLDDFLSRDVLQESMILLMRKLPDFTYEAERGRFRNWLLTLVRGKIRDARRRMRRLAELPLPEHLPSFAGGGGEVTCGETEDEEVEAAWRQVLLEEALKRLKQNPRIKPETMAVFEACVLENLPIPLAAERFKLQENNIYQIKNRLLRLLRAEVEHLDQNQPGDWPDCSPDEQP